MRRILSVAICLFATCAAHGGRAARPVDGVRVLSSRLLQVPNDAGGLLALSPSGRYALTVTGGPGSFQLNHRVLDLTGAARPAGLPYTPSAAFLPGRDTLVYWSVPSPPGGPCGLHLREFPSGMDRRVFPSTAAQEQEGAFNACGAEWDASTGELLCTRFIGASEEELWGVRLTDGRARRIGPRTGLISPDRKRLAFGHDDPVPMPNGRDTTVRSVWVSDLDGRNAKRLVAGEPQAWADAGRTLVVVRSGHRTGAVFRVDVATGKASFLADEPGSCAVSPSGRWLVTMSSGPAKLVSTQDGRQLSLPLHGVRSVQWGRSDRELLCGMPDGLRLVTIYIGVGGAPGPRVPVAHTVPISLGPPVALEWHPLPAAPGPWQLYATDAETRAVAAAPGGLLLGTGSGVRSVTASGAARPAKPWQVALRGQSVDAIAVQGETVWVAASRNMSRPTFGASVEGSLVRVDTRTGQMALARLDAGPIASGMCFGQLLLTTPRVAVPKERGSVFVWDDRSFRRVMTPDASGRPSGVPAACVALGSAGSLWLGQPWGGLLRWRPGDDTATLWTEKEGLASGNVTSVAEDRGRVWVGTAGGLSLLSPVTGGIQSNVGREVIGTQPVLQLAATPGALYARTARWLAARDARTGRWRRWPLPRGAPARLFAVRGRLLGVFGEQGPLREFDGLGRWRVLIGDPAGQIARNEVLSAAWEDGKLWCGHVRSLSRLDPATGRWSTFALPALPAASPGKADCGPPHLEGGDGVALDPVRVVRLALQGGHVWAGLWAGGVLELDPRTGSLRRWLQMASSPNGPRWVEMNGLAVDPDWVTVVDRNAVHRADRRTGKVITLSSPGPGMQPLQDLEMVARDGRTLYAVGTQGYGPKQDLLAIDLPTGKTARTPDTMGVSGLDPLAVVPGRGFWIYGEPMRLVAPDGRVVASLRRPRRYRNTGVEAIAYADGYVYCAHVGWAKGASREPALSRMRVSDGQWQEIAGCPIAGVGALLPVGATLWVTGSNGVARLSLAQHPPVTMTDPDKPASPPLEEVWTAVRYHDVAEVRSLLDGGVPVDLRSDRRETLLMAAAGTDSTAMVELLLDRGADINAIDEDGETALSGARSSLPMATFLLNHGADPNRCRNHGRPLLVECLSNALNLPLARLLVEKGADVNLADTEGYTALMGAAVFGSHDLLRLIIAHGARPDAQDPEGKTALDRAVQGDAGAVSILLSAGADVNLRDKQGETALLLASSGSVEIVRALLAKGARLEDKQANGWTPLLRAAADWRGDIVQVLVEAGANVNARSNSGQTPLMFAATRNGEEMARLLLTHGADPNARDNDGFTPLKFCGGQGPVADMLRAAGAKE